MSTTQNFNVYKGFTYTIKARSAGKYDYKSNQTFNTDGQTVNFSMTDYDGLSENYEKSYQSANKLDFLSTVLPWKWEYSTSLSTSRYCLMPIGQDYENIHQVGYIYNFDVVGSPNVNYDTKTVTGFSTSNYVKLPTAFNPGTSSWEQQWKFTTGDSFPEYQRITGTDTDAYGGANLVLKRDAIQCWMTSDPGYWNIWNGEDYGGTSSSILSTNTTYWVRMSYDGNTTYKLSYSTDGINFTDLITKTVNDHVVSYQVTNIGAGSGNYPFNGTIDLSECYIKVNNVNWWVLEPTEVAKIITDYTIVGNPTISNDYVVNRFSTSNYLSVTNRQTYTTGTINSMEIMFKIHTPNSSSWSSNGRLINSANSFDNFAVEVSQTSIALNIVPAGNFSGSYSFDSGKDYWIKIIYDGTNFTIYCSDDGVTYITVATDSFVPYIDDTAYSVGCRAYTSADSSCVFNGSIYLKDSYIKINGNIWWLGVDEPKETLPGCTYNFVDDGTAVTLNCFVVNGDESIVLTPDNSYTNGWKLGTVTIPQHKIYTYNNGVWTEVI